MPLPPFEKTGPNVELRRVWKGKYPLPTGSQQLQFTPFAPKPGGGFVGALYKKAPTKPGKTANAAKTWLGKPGFAYRGFEKSNELEKTRTITRRGLDAIAEKIAGDAYHAANTGRYFIPKHRLALLPVRHKFLQEEHHTLVDFALNEINKNRPVPITETIHVFSKWIEGFQDLASIQTRLNGAVIPFMDAIIVHQCLPDTVFVDGVDVPLMGLIDILAVSRLIADSDVLGGKGDNAGIIVYRDPQGTPVVAKAVKIDPGFAFNFRGHENRFQRTQTAQFAAMGRGRKFVPEADMLLDLKDIQFGNNYPVNIQWSWLSATQQCDFLLALQQGKLALGEDKMIEILLLRGGDFKLNGEELMQVTTAATLAEQWRENISDQEKCYEREVLRHREGLAQRQRIQEREWTAFANRLKDNPPAAENIAASAAARDEGAAAEREIPPGFICSISQEIMMDPVITPSGRSFERVLIEDWVRQSGTDPLTRQPLRLDQLIPNRDLKAAIERWFLVQAPATAQPRVRKINAAEAPTPATVSAVTRAAPPPRPTITEPALPVRAFQPTPAARPATARFTATPAPTRAVPVAAAAAVVGLFAPPRSASAQAAAAVVNQADVDKLLLHVARGEQNEAEAILKIRGNEVLLLHKGTVTDYSGRTFENLTGFQYALWALDWHMWTMLRKYLPNEKAKAQLEELETYETAHGKHYDFRPLIQALRTYVNNYNQRLRGVEKESVGDKLVGKAQALVPAHVANEYCHPSRSFDPTPAFTDLILPRMLSLKDYHHGVMSWFDVTKWGSTFLGNYGWVYRGPRAKIGAPQTGEFDHVNGVHITRYDLSAITALCKVRTAQLAELTRELAHVPAKRFGFSS